MIQIRDVLQVKFGKIDQAVELFTQLSTPDANKIVTGEHFEVLTDITVSSCQSIKRRMTVVLIFSMLVITWASQ